MKTIEEILSKSCGLERVSDAKAYCDGKVFWEHAIEAMHEYSLQEVNSVVDKTLETTKQLMVQYGVMLSDNTILSLRTQILNEIKDR